MTRRRAALRQGRSGPLLLRLALLLAGCAGSVPATADGPVARALDGAARVGGAPRDLLVAIAAVEGGLKLPARRVVRDEDHVPVAGALELRHGAFDSLARGAQLA